MIISTQRKPIRIGEILLHQGWVQGQDLEDALNFQKYDEKKRPLGKILIDNGVISKNILYQALAIQFGKQFVDLSQIKIQAKALQAVSKQFAVEHGLIPITIQEGMMLVAIPDPMNLASLKDLECVPGIRDIEIVLATDEDIEKTIKRYYGNPISRLKDEAILKLQSTLRYFISGETSNF
ncbi:MAG: hypothetical protein EXS63_02455 [Candidatus Omnitrophica bacterium]|nr:hypothetical protein [Candidatus Omnitrophota bacterium]